MVQTDEDITKTSYTEKRPQYDPLGGNLCSPTQVLSVLSGANHDRVAIQAALTLAGLAGPRAGLVTLGGEVQPIGANLIGVSGDSPRQARLTELLFSPLRFLQDDLMDYSRRVPAELPKRLSTSIADPHCLVPGESSLVREEERAGAELRYVTQLAGKSSQVVSESHPVDRKVAFEREKSVTEEEKNERASLAAMCDLVQIEYETMLKHNEARCLLEPIVLLENPDADVLLDFLVHVDRQSPMILDANGSLLRNALDNPNSKTTRMIERLFAGRCVCAVRGGGVAQTRGTIFTSLDCGSLAALGNTEALRGFLSRSLFVDPGARNAGDTPLSDPEMIKEGYSRYRKAVKNVLRLRRLDAPGVAPILGDQTAQEWFAAQMKFEEQVEGVEPNLRPFATNFIHLPATMLWALGFLCPERNRTELISSALHLSEIAMSSHLGLIKKAHEASERRELEDHAGKMLLKLLRCEPCRPRELYRKFDLQKKALHEPVLEYLIETDRVRWTQTGQLQLTDQARGQLTERSL